MASSPHIEPVEIQWEQPPQVLIDRPGGLPREVVDINFAVGRDGSVRLTPRDLSYLSRKAGTTSMVWVTPGVPVEEEPEEEIVPGVVPEIELIRPPDIVVPVVGHEVVDVSPRLSFYDERVILDKEEETLIVEGSELMVQPLMFAILRSLMDRHDTVVGHDVLRTEVWGGRDLPTKTKTVSMSRCRALFGPAGAQVLVSCRNVGYMFDSQRLIESFHQ